MSSKQIAKAITNYNYNKSRDGKSNNNSKIRIFKWKSIALHIKVNWSVRKGEETLERAVKEVGRGDT